MCSLLWDQQSSHVITQQIMTELSSGFNSIGFGAFDQVKTTESQNWLGLHLFRIWKQTVGCSKSFKVIQNVCLLHGYDKRGDGLVTLVQKKRKSSNRKAQYGISYPTHLTRLEEQMKTLPYPPYIGMALKLCACRLFTRTTCSLLLPGLELNMTFSFRPCTVCPFHSDMKTSLQLRSMGWNLANLSVTAPIDLFQIEDVVLLSGYSAPFKSAYNDVYTDPSNGWNRPSFIIFLIGRSEINIHLPVCFHHLYPKEGINQAFCGIQSDSTSHQEKNG